MQVYKVLAGIGAIVLALSVLMPARMGSVVGQVAYIAAQPVNGFLLIAVAVMAVLLIYSNRSNYMFVLAMAALVTVAAIYLRRGENLVALPNDISRLTAQVAALPLVRTSTGAVNYVGGWWMMALGALLMMAASLIVPKRR